MSRGTPDPARRVSDFMYEAFTLSGGTSQTLLLSSTLPYRSPYPVVHAQRFGLFRVRSPLLAESFLFSLPTGNEMFQFPAFAYRLAVYQLALMGCPIRKSAGHRIFAPYRSFSQLITSFFASESLGIHLSPLFTSCVSPSFDGSGIHTCSSRFLSQYVNVLVLVKSSWRITDSNR